MTCQFGSLLDFIRAPNFEVRSSSNKSSPNIIAYELAAHQAAFQWRAAVCSTVRTERKTKSSQPVLVVLATQ